MFNLHIIFVATAFGLSACTSKIEVRGTQNIKALGAEVETINLKNGKLTIDGKNLEQIKKWRLVGENTNIELTATQESNGSIILGYAGNAIAITLDSIFKLITTDALGAELSFDLKFKLDKGSITAEMFSRMGAEDGNVMVFNGKTNKWEAKALSGLNYQGTWNASLGKPPFEQEPNPGDYWIVTKDGEFTLSTIENWQIGDWAIYNGTEWQKINNSNEVLSFNGRKGIIIPKAGDYNWSQIDKSNSSLSDISNSKVKDLSDVNIDGLTAGQVLVWDGSRWRPQDLSGTSTSNITDGTITNADIAAGAAIDMTKINGLTTAINSKQNAITLGNNTQYFKGDLSLGIFATDARSVTVADSINDNIIDVAPSQNSVFDALATKQNAITTGATTSYFKGDLSLGVFNDDVRNAAVSDSLSDGISNIAPSQNAVFDALASKGDLKADGSVSMTADFNFSDKAAKFKDADTNTISIKAPTDVTANYNLILPSTVGTNGQVLKTDGAGNLTWAADNNAGVTANSVDSSSISNGSIVNDDISVSAAIAQSKIDGLTTTLSGKEPTITSGDNTQFFRGDKTWQTLNTTNVTEGSNLYYTDARAKNATVSNSITDAINDVAPSQNAVFDALALKQNAISTGVTTEYFRGDLSRADFATDVKLVAVGDAIADAVTDKAPSQNAVFDALVAKMTGATSSTDNALVRFDGTTGKVIQNSSVTLDDNGNFNLPNTTSGSLSGIIYKNNVPFLHNFNFGNNGTVTTAGNNTIIGENAGNLTMGSTATLSTHASDNTIIGAMAGNNITNGSNNSFFGSLTGWLLTSGERNTFIGNKAGLSTTTGSDNVFLGVNTGLSNDEGDYNTYVGNYSAFNLSGLNYSNSFFGFNIAPSLTNGSQNIVLGSFAGNFIENNSPLTSLQDSILLGTKTRTKLNNSINEIVIGTEAVGKGSNTVTLGNDSVTDTYLKGKVSINSAKMPTNSSAPFTCDANATGSIALNTVFISCVCNGSSWVSSLNGEACIWNAKNIVSHGTGRRWSDGTYATSCNGYKNPSGNYTYTGLIGTGRYTIDPDDAGATAPMDAYCDMTTDQGGWTLVLNYLHLANTNPALSYKTTSLPIQNSTTLGVDESSNSENWGHATPALMTTLGSFNDYFEIRFFCKTSYHNRQIHFKNSTLEVKNYFKTGTTMSSYGWYNRSVELPGGGAYLPTAATHRYQSQGNNAMTEYPFFYNDGTTTHYAWSIGATPSNWGCDAMTNSTVSTFHQIWIR